MSWNSNSRNNSAALYLAWTALLLGRQCPISDCRALQRSRASRGGRHARRVSRATGVGICVLRRVVSHSPMVDFEWRRLAIGAGGLEAWNRIWTYYVTFVTTES